MCRFAMGQFQSARELLREALELLRSADLTAVRSMGHALSYLALVDFMLGDAKSAGELTSQSVAWSQGPQGQ